MYTNYINYIKYDYILRYFEKEVLGSCNTTSSSGHQYMMPQSDHNYTIYIQLCIRRNGCYRVLSKKLWIFPSQKRPERGCGYF